MKKLFILISFLLILSGVNAQVPVRFLGAVIEDIYTVVLSYDQILDSINYPTPDRFNVIINGANNPANKLIVTGKIVKLKMVVPFKLTDKVLVSYVKPKTNLLKSVSGIQAPTLQSLPVVNNLIDVIVPDVLRDTIFIRDTAFINLDTVFERDIVFMIRSDTVFMKVRKGMKVVIDI